MQASAVGPSTDRPVGVQAIDDLDLGALGRTMWARKRWIIGLTLAAAVLAFVAVNLVTPRYKSESRVLIETRDNIFLRPDAEKTTERNTTVDQEAVTSQVQLILSRDLAREMIRKLKLGERPEFDPVLRGASMIKTVLGVLGLAKDPMSETPEERVLKSYFERMTAYQVEKSRVIAIEFELEDPELAARAANAIAEGYLGLQQVAKQEQSRSAGAWLASRIDELRGKVAEAEGKVEQYRSKSNLFIGNNNTSLSNQQLGDINAQLASARAQKSDAEAKARVLRDLLRAGASVEFSDIANSELIRRLSEQRITLRAQLAEQASTLLGQHPRIKELRAQISDLEGQIRGEADRLARSFETDAKMAGAKVENLSQSLDQLKKQAASSNDQDVQLRALERDAKSQRDLLESYLAKYREATARDSIGAASPDARIISSATVSNTPAWPKKLPTVLVASLGMFTLAMGFVLSSALLGTMSGGVRPAPRVVDEPNMARLPAVSAPAFADAQETTESAARAEDAGGAPADRQPDAVEVFAREMKAADRDSRRVAMLGMRRNVGTTLSAIALARLLAKEGRVILIDLALVAPNLSVIAADAGTPGISELVLGSASFGDVITRDRQSRAHLIMAGRAEADVDAVFNSQRLAVTLEALARSYDYVVIDAGAMSEATVARYAKFASWAALVADSADDPALAASREQLVAAGFAKTSVLAGTPRASTVDTSAARAAA